MSHPVVRLCMTLKRRHEAKWKTVLVSLLVGGCAVVALPSTAQAQSDGDFFRCLVAGAYGVDDMGDRAGQVMSMNDGLPRLRAAMDSLAAETGVLPEQVEAEWQEMMARVNSREAEEFVVDRSTGRIIHEQIRNFGRGRFGLENPGEPRVVKRESAGVESNEYIAVTIREDEVFPWQNDVEYLRIYSTGSAQQTFVYIDGGQLIRTGTCELF